MSVTDYRGLEERLPDSTAERSANIKAELYEHGVSMSEDAIKEHLGEGYKENQYGFDNPNEKVDRKLPSEILLPDAGKTQGKRGVVTLFRYREDSPFVIKHTGSYELHVRTSNGTEHLTDIELPIRPDFWDKTLDDGKPMRRVGNVYGTDCYNVCVRNRCQFWSTNSQCRFCSMNTTHQLYENVEIQKQIEDIADIAVEAFGNGQARVATFTGGSFWNHNKEVRFYIDMLNEIGDRLGRDKLRDFVVITMPPMDFELIDELHETGVEFVTFNMEAFSPEGFQTMVPGKAKYGREKFLDALEYAADVFGDGRAWSNLIIDIDDPESIKEGFEEFCTRGVNPGGHVFHPDRNSILHDKDAPDAETVKDIYRHGADLLHDYGYKPYLTDNSLRSSLMWEAYYGWL